MPLRTLMVLDGVSFFYVTGQKLIIYFLLCLTDFFMTAYFSC